MQKKAFTLLELIILIIIIGVLASLAIPRFLGIVEFSRSVEALSSIGTISRSMERCFMGTNDYDLCLLNSPGPDPDNLDVDNPGTAPGAHFDYRVNPLGAPFKYRITATRNALDNGTAGDHITFTYREDGSVTKSGTGAFASIH